MNSLLGQLVEFLYQQISIIVHSLIHSPFLHLSELRIHLQSPVNCKFDVRLPMTTALLTTTITAGRGTMDDLPLDLQLDILANLPVDFLCRLKVVCKAWCVLINDNHFRKVHTHRLQRQPSTDVSFLLLLQFVGKSEHRFHFGEFWDDEEGGCSMYRITKSINHPPVDERYFLPVNKRYCHRNIIGSCNGLVCLALSDRYDMPDHLYIFNPVTSECVDLPSLESDRSVRGLLLVNGFGFHPSTRDYKVVRIYYGYPSGGEDSLGEIDVYTLGSGKWRRIGEVPVLFTFLAKKPGVLANGALHWIDEDGNIASFDLDAETFHMVPLPSELNLVPNEYNFYDLGVLEERLCIIEHNPGKNIEIWIIENKDLSWRKEFVIAILEESMHHTDSSESDCCTFITFTKSGKVLLWYNEKVLSSYDPKKEELKLHGDNNVELQWFQAVLHMRSFISLRALGEDAHRITQSEEGKTSREEYSFIYSCSMDNPPQATPPTTSLATPPMTFLGMPPTTAFAKLSIY